MSDKVFGLAWLFILGGITLFPLISGAPPYWPSGGIFVILAAIVLICPSRLAPLNRMWQAFGKMMHACISTITLTCLYFMVLTPGAWIVRLCGHNAISRTFDPAVDSYWSNCEAESPTDFTRPY